MANLGPVGSRPVPVLLFAKMQFSAILGHFLPQDPRCATLRCTFISQIFYILYFILLARILDTLDQFWLDLCFMQYAVLCCGTPPVRPTHTVSNFQDSFFFTMDVLQPLDPVATMTTCATLWPLLMLFQLHGHPAGPAPSHHAHPPVQPPAPSWLPLPCSLQFAALLFFLLVSLLLLADVVLQLRLLGLLSAPLLSPVWA